MWLMQRMRRITSLEEMTMSDNIDLRQCRLYLLAAAEEGEANF